MFPACKELSTCEILHFRILNTSQSLHIIFKLIKHSLQSAEGLSRAYGKYDYLDVSSERLVLSVAKLTITCSIHGNCHV